MFFQLFLKNIVLDFLRFPLWWYSRGALAMVQWVGRAIAAREAAIGVRIWVKNLFVPMYGQYNWQGRIISFFFRVFFIVVRTGWLVVWIGIILALLALYLVWPLGALGGLIAVLA